MTFAAISPPGNVHYFPGPAKAVTSPDRQFVVTVTALQVDQDKGPSYLLSVRDRHLSRRFDLLKFGRSAALTWAPTGHRFIITNALASDRSDCLVARPSHRGVAVVSLTGLVLASPGTLKPEERPDTAHFYVECDRWTSPDVVKASVFGHTDTVSVHRFCAAFRYNLQTGSVRWGARQTPMSDLDQSC